jgi:hypothetical protein
VRWGDIFMFVTELCRQEMLWIPQLTKVLSLLTPGGRVSRGSRSLIGGILVGVLVQSPAVMAAPPRAASTPAMGVILQAERANIGGGPATIGTTVFDGDSLQTDRNGLLRVRSDPRKRRLSGAVPRYSTSQPMGFPRI